MFKFDEKSPITDKTTVYAVYGNEMTIRLHRNSKLSGEDKVYEFKVSASDFESKKGKITLPRAYDNQAMELPEEFKVDKYTFVGWKYDKEDASIDLSQGVIEDGKHVKEITIDTAKEEGRRILDGTTIEFTGDFADYAKDGIDLYGIYAPYIEIKAEKKFQGIDATTMPTVNIGLLYRTAVTAYNNPTIANSAAYFVPQDAKKIDEKAYQSYSTQGYSLTPIPKEAILKFYSPKKGHTKDDLQWSMRGYDENGDRLSYITVEVPNYGGTIASTETAKDEELKNAVNSYYEFNQEWKTLGITVNPGAAVTASGKTQIITLEDKKNDGSSSIDAFSGATVRTVTHTNEEDIKSPVKSYSFIITNTKLNVADPVIKDVYAGDNSFELIKPTVSNDIKYINIKVKDKGTEKENIYRFKHGIHDYTWELVGEDDNNINENMKAEWKTTEQKLVITTQDGEYAKGDIITVQYDFGTKDSPQTSNEISTTVIAKPKAGKVNNLKQKPNLDSKDPTNGEDYDTVVIEGQRPNSGVAVPTKDATYTIGTVDVSSGEFIPLKDNDGQIITIPMDPNNSIVRFEIPKDKVKDGQELVIQSKDKDKDSIISDKIALDLKAPEVSHEGAIDGAYRMFIDISAQIDNTLDIRDGRTKIKVNSDEYKLEPRQINQQGEGFKINLSAVVPRPADSTDKAPIITLIVMDELNNKGEVNIKYSPSVLKPEFEVENPRVGYDYIDLNLINGTEADKFGIRIMRKESDSYKEIYNKEHGIVQGERNLFVELKDDSSEALYLEKGDFVIITAVNGDITSSMRLRVR